MTGRHDQDQSASHSPRSASPDPDLQLYLNDHSRTLSPATEALRNQRIAAGGVTGANIRFQQDRQDVERRQQQEQEREAKAYRVVEKDHQGGGGSNAITFVRAGGQLYTQSQGRNLKRGPSSGVGSDAVKQKRPRSFASNPMQSFLGELQRDQAEREERLKSQVSETTSMSLLLARETQEAGPDGQLDPESSNICVMDLPTDISEMDFGKHFSYYGDIASMKIIWPRLQYEEVPKTLRVLQHEGHLGFVNYMHRSDAEAAYKKIAASIWKGAALRTGWGKSMPKPPRPMLFQKNCNQVEFEAETEHVVELESVKPEESFDEHVVKAFQDDENGDGDDDFASSISQNGGSLLDTFDCMLQRLTLKRESVAEAMRFAIENAALHAEELAERLIDSLLLPTTPLPRKRARLYLLSDILYNSSSERTGAWKYRSAIDQDLSAVFAHWGDISDSYQGRIRSEACKDVARLLLDVWNSWNVFDTKSLQEWRIAVESGSKNKNQDG